MEIKSKHTMIDEIASAEPTIYIIHDNYNSYMAP